MGAARRSRIGFAVVFAIVLVVGAVAFLNGRQFIETNRTISQAIQVQLALSEILTLALDAETAGRGYYITGDEAYLEPYYLAQDRIEPTFVLLSSLIDDPVQREQLAVLRDALNKRLESVVATIERRGPVSFEESQASDTVLARGKEQMDEIRRLVAEMQTAEEQLLQERNTSAEQTASATFAVFGALTLLAMAMLWLIFALIQRSFAESQRIEHDLEQRVAKRTRQLKFLADASSVLTEPVAYQQKLSQLAQIAVDQIADVCAIYIVDNADNPNPTLEPVVLAHQDPNKLSVLLERAAKNPPGPNSSGGIYTAFSTGQTIHYQDIDDLVAKFGEDSPQVIGLRRLGIKSMIIVPLSAGGKRLGVLSLTTDESGRVYSDSDVTLAEELAYRAGLLIENGRLFTRIRQLNSELEGRVKERTQQLEAINTELEAFNYSVSHDLRAPLRSIDGFSQALLEDYSDTMPPAAQSYLTRVRNAAQRMGILIDDLLALSRITRVEMKRSEVDISRISSRIVEGLQLGEPERNVAVTIENDLVAEADVHLVEIMLNNLIGNAWKFTRKTDAACIEVGSTSVNGKAAFFVRDNGAGFDMSYVDRLFGAFERLHSSTEFEGTGIGLATVQRIVNRHGGTVWAEGKIGEGATFYFRLTSDT